MTQRRGCREAILRGSICAFLFACGPSAWAHEPADPYEKPEPLSIATLIGLKGHACLEVVRKRRLQRPEKYEVECRTGGARPNVTYLLDTTTGKVTPRGLPAH
jgi:hypothetical protein